MPIAFDIAGDVIRLRGPESAGRHGTRTVLGTVGVPPRIPRESFIWNNPKAARSSRPRLAVSLADAWAALSNEAPGTYQWQYDSGDNGYRSLTDMIGEAAVQVSPAARQHKTVVAIDNHLGEEGQERLLTSFGSTGAGDIELLWRPIALVLAYLEAAPEGSFHSGDRILVIDAESTQPEVTCIELRDHDGRLLPLRSAPVVREGTAYAWGAHSCRRRIADSISAETPALVSQLFTGPFSAEFVAFTECRDAIDVWCRVDSIHVQVPLSGPRLQGERDGIVQRIPLDSIRAELSTQHDMNSMAAVLWHGWPLCRCSSAQLSERDTVLPSDAIALGADIYGRRLLAGEPTYLDTLPGLYILSEVKELKTFAYFPLVVAGVQEGGQAWRLPDPLTRFSVTQGVSEFPAVLRRSDETQCRRVITEIPAPSEDTPVLIRAEMKPAHGRAKVTIEGGEGHEDVFGDKRAVVLNWKNMTQIDDPVVSAPAVYPVTGRLFDDPEYLGILVALVSDPRASVYSRVQYRGHEVAFWKLMQPWGYSPPWHGARGVPTGWDSEPTRGMFGSEYIARHGDLIQRLVARIESTARTNDRLKLLNYMFVYAPESYRQELREKFSEQDPDFDSWNWVIGPGRVFSTRKDFGLFVEFMLRIADGGYPSHPDNSYTQHYWWSYFRCLCYHMDTVNISTERVTQVLEMMHSYIGGQRLNATQTKYCLCAILFSTRLRTRLPSFLQPVDDLCVRLAEDVSERMSRVRYPPAMLAEVDDPYGEGLNGLVSRFLLQTATADDFRALEGLTTSMA